MLKSLSEIAGNVTVGVALLMWNERPVLAVLKWVSAAIVAMMMQEYMPVATLVIVTVPADVTVQPTLTGLRAYVMAPVSPAGPWTPLVTLKAVVLNVRSEIAGKVTVASPLVIWNERLALAAL